MPDNLSGDQEAFSLFDQGMAAIGSRDPISAIRSSRGDLPPDAYGPLRWAARHFLFQDDADALASLIGKGLGLEWPIAFHHGALLHEAALVGAPRCARLLLRLGSDPDALNDDGDSPLGIACIESRLDLIRILRRGGSSLPSSPLWRGRPWDPRRAILAGMDLDFHGSGLSDLSSLLPGSIPCLLWADACGYPLSGLLEPPLPAQPREQGILHALHEDPAFAPVLAWIRSRSEREAIRRGSSPASRSSPPRGL